MITRVKWEVCCLTILAVARWAQNINMLGIPYYFQQFFKIGIGSKIMYFSSFQLQGFMYFGCSHQVIKGETPPPISLCELFSIAFFFNLVSQIASRMEAICTLNCGCWF